MDSMKSEKTLYIFLDMKEQKFWIDENRSKLTEEEYENIGTPLNSDILIYQAINSTEEKSTGIISFSFFPDGTNEFGMLYIENINTGERFTLFLHPFFQKAKILEGEVSAEDGPPYNLSLRGAKRFSLPLHVVSRGGNLVVIPVKTGIYWIPAPCFREDMFRRKESINFLDSRPRLLSSRACLLNAGTTNCVVCG